MLIAFLIVIALSLALVLVARHGHGTGGAHDFFIAGRQLGPVLVFFLSVGETYSIASMLGFPGGVYARGDAISTWFFGYVLLISPVVFAVGPWIWRAGALYRAATMPDVFRAHFDSRPLEVLLALSSIVLLVPIGTMQVLGLRIVLGDLAPGVAPMVLTGLAGLMAFAYVATAGLRGSAFVAVLKDVLMIGAILLVSGAALAHWSTGMAPAAYHPAPVTRPADIHFALSTIVLQSVAYAMIPQTWTFIFSARSPMALRRSQIPAPLYMLMFPPLMLTANYALTHALVPPTPDHVFLTVSAALVPGWAHGLVLASVTLAGLVVLSSVCLAIGPLVSRNLVPGLGEAAQQRGAKLVTALYLLLCVVGAGTSTSLIATLNTVFYVGVAQTLPAFVAALWSGRTPARAVIAGMLAGDAAASLIVGSGMDVGGVNPGMVALIPNVAVMAAWTALAPRRDGRSMLARLRGTV